MKGPSQLAGSSDSRLKHSPGRARVLRYLLVLYVVFLISLTVLVSLRELPEWAMQVYRLPHGDLKAHLGLSAGLTFLAEGAAGRRTTGILGRRVPAGATWTLLALVLDEVLQLAVPARVFSFIDMAATCIGVAIGRALAALLMRR